VGTPVKQHFRRGSSFKKKFPKKEHASSGKVLKQVLMKTGEVLGRKSRGGQFFAEFRNNRGYQGVGGPNTWGGDGAESMVLCRRKNP